MKNTQKIAIPVIVIIIALIAVFMLFKKYIQAYLFIWDVPPSLMCYDENRGSWNPLYNPSNYDFWTFKYELTNENMSAGDCAVKLIGDKDTLVIGSYYVERVDTKTFTFYENEESKGNGIAQGGYAKDKDNVYYVGVSDVLDGGGYAFGNPTNIVVADITDEVEVINNNYAVINDYLYFHDEKVIDATVENVATLEDSRYVTDGLNIYYNGKIMAFAQYGNFSLVLNSQDAVTQFSELYGYSDTSIFYGLERIGERFSTETPVLASSLDWIAFKMESDPRLYLLNGNYGYYDGVFMGKVDQGSFTIYPYKISKDKFRYFCGSTAIPYSIGNADAQINNDYTNYGLVVVDLYYPDCKAGSIFRFTCDNGNFVSFEQISLPAVGVSLSYGYDGDVVSHECTKR